MRRILVTGATGQIGSELTPALRQRYGAEQVVAVGHRNMPTESLRSGGPYAACDARDNTALAEIVQKFNINTIYHLAALLSVAAEKDPQLAWDVNMNGLQNVLEIARSHGCGVFHPSSIAAFGPDTPPINTPQVTIQRPNTMYGISKVAAELLCDYYYTRYRVDTRGVRYPGLISHIALPGGGTTDYAVEIFYAALRKRKYTCPLKPDTRLDMMYMPDAIQAAMRIMEADSTKLLHRNAYNITAMSFSPMELAAAIKKKIPEFTINYEVDPIHQAIADSWPDNMNDSAARSQWGWASQYDLERMTSDMLARLAAKLTA
ncbi:MAG: NAD-dependent epimerase/dehydratase family protein [Desulfobulbaceae bacterium]|uniref:NAD-dependent epimerase/dehydratase family protein n=1 Tax=Candidatus Desulfatifera sulfidica TaxID=2841691 RepID=A0A8J6N871_9BACT|nr:NAD-dependent epimerase/dehydratase family protein [Candidatus Desulfatifera sulfidica]